MVFKIKYYLEHAKMLCAALCQNYDQTKTILLNNESDFVCKNLRLKFGVRQVIFARILGSQIYILKWHTNYQLNYSFNLKFIFVLCLFVS